MKKINVVFILFVLTVISLPILFPGDGVNINGFLALIALALVSLFVIGTVLVIMQRKSGMSWKEAGELSRRILDDAENGYRPWMEGISPDELMDFNERELNEFLERGGRIIKQEYLDEDGDN